MSLSKVNVIEEKTARVDQWLLENPDVSISKAADALGVSWSLVDKRIKHLGLQKKCNVRKFSLEEDMYILQNKDRPYAQIGLKIGRHPNSIRARLDFLVGIKERGRYPAEVVAKIRHAAKHPNGRSLEEIAREIGISSTGLKSFMKKEGLEIPRFYFKFTEQQDAQIIKAVSDVAEGRLKAAAAKKALAAAFKVDEQTIYVRSFKIGHPFPPPDSRGNRKTSIRYKPIKKPESVDVVKKLYAEIIHADQPHEVLVKSFLNERNQSTLYRQMKNLGLDFSFAKKVNELKYPERQKDGRFKWTTLELEMLRGEKTDVELAFVLARTESAIGRKRLKEGLVKRDTPRPWNPNDDRVFQNPKLTDQEIAEMTGRTVVAVSTRRKSLGFKRRSNLRAWSLSDVSALISLLNEGAADEVIATELGRTVESVKHKRLKLKRK